MKKNKLKKVLKKRAKTTEKLSDNRSEELQTFHEMLLADGQSPKLFRTSGYISFWGVEGKEMEEILTEKGIIKNRKFTSDDYRYYPHRMEQLVEKIKQYYCFESVSYFLEDVDEKVLTKRPKKTRIPAKSTSLNELKGYIYSCGPGAFFDIEKKNYSSGTLIRTHPVLFQDISEDLSSIDNTHEDNSHEMWQNQHTLLGEQKLGNFEFLCAAAGSDVEIPKVFILYLDNEGELRGYVPKKGNPFNVEREFDVTLDDWEKDLSNYYNWNEIKQDILENIQVV